MAEQLFDMATKTLGIGVASVVKSLDVELVVIGGGLAEKLGQDLADRITMPRPRSRPIASLFGGAFGEGRPACCQERTTTA